MACSHGKRSLLHRFRLKPPGYSPFPDLREPVANPSSPMSLIQPAPAVLGPLPLPAAELIVVFLLSWACCGCWLWSLLAKTVRIRSFVRLFQGYDCGRMQATQQILKHAVLSYGAGGLRLRIHAMCKSLSEKTWVPAFLLGMAIRGMQKCLRVGKLQ